MNIYHSTQAKEGMAPQDLIINLALQIPALGHDLVIELNIRPMTTLGSLPLIHELSATIC
jgi:hypothetical protein